MSWNTEKNIAPSYFSPSAKVAYDIIQPLASLLCGTKRNKLLLLCHYCVHLFHNYHSYDRFLLGGMKLGRLQTLLHCYIIPYTVADSVVI